MKIKQYWYLFLIGFLFLSFNFPNFNFEDGLVAHYTFNKCGVTDVTGINPEGEISGAPSCHCGIEGNALFFDGINDYVEFPGSVNRYFNTTDFTVSFYVKSTKYSIFKQSLLSKRDSCNEYNMLDFQLDLNKREIKTDLYETPEKYFKDISPKTPRTDWIHFALVRKGIRAYTYVNGQLKKEGRRCSGVDIGNKTILSFSNTPCLANGRTVRFKGGLDELRIYDHALTDEEIIQLYSRYPVETAEVDCITFHENNGREKMESAYLCGNSD